MRTTAFCVAFVLSACGAPVTGDDGGSTETDGGSTSDAGSTTGVPTVFTTQYTSAVTLSATATTVTLRSAGVPDHKSPYWGVGHALYEAQPSGKTVNPGIIREQVFAMTIPITPEPAATKEATALGPIGMAINGVAIYNDREGGNVPVDTGVLGSMDVYGAHVGPGGVYHYHFEPMSIGNDNAVMIGHLRDGYPIYARRDMNDTAPTDLDSNGGHVAATSEYPLGIYHYHCSTVNYLNGGYYIIKAGSYHGTKGTFTF